MDVIYKNDLYSVFPLREEGVYAIINKKTNVIEVKEPSLPTALFKADALLSAMKKHHSYKEEWVD